MLVTQQKVSVIPLEESGVDFTVAVNDEIAIQNDGEWIAVLITVTPTSVIILFNKTQLL